MAVPVAFYFCKVVTETGFGFYLRLELVQSFLHFLVAIVVLNNFQKVVSEERHSEKNKGEKS